MSDLEQPQHNYDGFNHIIIWRYRKTHKTTQEHTVGCISPIALDITNSYYPTKAQSPAAQFAVVPYRY